MRNKNSVKELTSIGLMTAMLCILAPFSFMLPGMVPVSLATLAIYFLPYILDIRRCMLCCLIYVILGSVGLPVFSGFSGGFSRLIGPTGGYIAGYFVIIIIEGVALSRFPNMKAAHIIGMSLGTACCYLIGTAWYCVSTGATFAAALTVAVLPFVPADAVKIAVTVILAPTVRSRLEKAGSLPMKRS